MAEKETDRITDANTHPWTTASDVTPSEHGLKMHKPIKSTVFVGIDVNHVREVCGVMFDGSRTNTVLLNDATHLEPDTIDTLIKMLYEKGIAGDDPVPTQILCVVSRLSANAEDTPEGASD